MSKPREKPTRLQEWHCNDSATKVKLERENGGGRKGVERLELQQREEFRPQGVRVFIREEQNGKQ
jgi:hypothetical protein